MYPILIFFQFKAMYVYIISYPAGYSYLSIRMYDSSTDRVHRDLINAERGKRKWTRWSALSMYSTTYIWCLVFLKPPNWWRFYLHRRDWAWFDRVCTVHEEARRWHRWPRYIMYCLYHREGWSDGGNHQGWKSSQITRYPSVGLCYVDFDLDL